MVKCFAFFASVAVSDEGTISFRHFSNGKPIDCKFDREIYFGRREGSSCILVTKPIDFEKLRWF